MLTMSIEELAVEEIDFDIIVVGGGFAGVTAARDCERNGYKTLLLEARDRLGGRTWTSEFEGEPIELGGTWIYNSQPFVWSEVIRYGLDNNGRSWFDTVWISE